MIKMRVSRRLGGLLYGRLQDCESYGGHTNNILCAEAANIFGMPPNEDFMLLIAERSFEGSKPLLIVDFMHTVVNETRRFSTGRYTTLEGIIARLLSKPFVNMDCSPLYGEVVHIGWEELP